MKFSLILLLHELFSPRNVICLSHRAKRAKRNSAAIREEIRFLLNETQEIKNTSLIYREATNNKHTSHSKSSKRKEWGVKYRSDYRHLNENIFYDEASETSNKSISNSSMLEAQKEEVNTNKKEEKIIKSVYSAVNLEDEDRHERTASDTDASNDEVEVEIILKSTAKSDKNAYMEQKEQRDPFSIESNERPQMDTETAMNSGTSTETIIIEEIYIETETPGTADTVNNSKTENKALKYMRYTIIITVPLALISCIFCTILYQWNKCQNKSFYYDNETLATSCVAVS